MPFETLAPQLFELNDGPKERVGFILKNGEIVEVENACSDPGDGFEVKGEDLLRYMDEIQATWHTHPGENSQLSSNDFYGFRNYPDWLHGIIGTDGVRVFRVSQGAVLEDRFYAL